MAFILLAMPLYGLHLCPVLGSQEESYLGWVGGPCMALAPVPPWLPSPFASGILADLPHLAVVSQSHLRVSLPFPSALGKGVRRTVVVEASVL